MNLKSIKRVAVLTIPVAAAIATSMAPASAAVGDYTTKTYIAWDYELTDKDATTGSQCDLNGKAPLDATKNGQSVTPPEEVGGYCKSNDGKIGYTHDVVKDTNKYYGELNLGKDDKGKPTGSAIGGNIITNDQGTVTGDELYYKTDYNKVNGPTGKNDPADQQYQVGVKQTNVDTTPQTIVYAQDQNRAGDQLGVQYNTTNGEVSVYTKYVDDTHTIGTAGEAGSATLTPTTESSYVIADTKP
ncbi:hypothetical protein [Smaragdicoccus niigatensis]|uniref:hypothetical protein n=1 Tax=Smaragdicoccus niigatensis TaxID=359359 RepID=UPI00035E831A|nr:hypothetical protein [Smaragdicoccus niigatensis]